MSSIARIVFAASALFAIGCDSEEETADAGAGGGEVGGEAGGGAAGGGLAGGSLAGGTLGGAVVGGEAEGGAISVGGEGGEGGGGGDVGGAGGEGGGSPGDGEACEAGEDVPGFCIDATECSDNMGTPEPGHCAGAANIQCCVDYACTNNAGVVGACIDEDFCETILGGTAEAGHCAGGATIKCCAM